jgi:hypothetical protein
MMLFFSTVHDSNAAKSFKAFVCLSLRCVLCTRSQLELANIPVERNEGLTSIKKFKNIENSNFIALNNDYNE